MRYALLFFTLVAGLSAQNTLTVVAGANQSAVINTEFGSAVTARVTDAFGNGVAGVSVTFTFPGGPNTATAMMNFGKNTQTFVTDSKGFASTGVLAADAIGGSYTGTVTAGALKATFQLSNTAYAAPTVQPESLSFSMNLGEQVPPSQTVNISSPTDGYTATADANWIKITLRSNTVMVVAVDPTGLGAGHYTGTIVVNGATNVPVSLTITARPVLFSLAGDAGLSFNYVQFTPRQTPRPADQFVTIWSSQQNLQVIVDETFVSPVNGKWLAAAYRRGTVTPLTLEIVVDPTGLTPGTYQASVRVTATTATNNPLLIPVKLTITRFPTARAPEISSVTNGASAEDGAISSGGLASLVADGLSCEGEPVVTVDGNTAKIVSAKGNRFGILVPDVNGRTRSQVQLTCDGKSSEAYSVPVSDSAPGIFAGDGGVAMAVNAKVRGRRALKIYGTGFGPMVTDDSGAQSLSLPVRVWLGGVEGRVLSVAASADLAGVTEMMVQVPETVDPGSTVSLAVTIGDVPAQAGLTVAVQ